MVPAPPIPARPTAAFTMAFAGATSVRAGQRASILARSEPSLSATPERCRARLSGDVPVTKPHAPKPSPLAGEGGERSEPGEGYAPGLPDRAQSSRRLQPLQLL